MFLAETVRTIHIDQEFPKSKIVAIEKGGQNNCFFCKYKGHHPYCNSDKTQYIDLLKVHLKRVQSEKKIKSAEIKEKLALEKITTKN